jgi:hypothetical protein
VKKFVLELVRSEHADQKRKFTGEPYVNHCISVMNLLHGFSATTLVTEDMEHAALCHDILEDTPMSYTELINYIGFKAATYVYFLTDNFGKPTIYNEQLMMAPNEVKLIKCCDILDNSSDYLLHKMNFDYLAKKQSQLHQMGLTHYIANMTDIQLSLMICIMDTVVRNGTEQTRSRRLAALLFECVMNNYQYVLSNFWKCATKYIDDFSSLELIQIVRASSSVGIKIPHLGWGELYRLAREETTRRGESESIWSGLPSGIFGGPANLHWERDHASQS